jgi:Acetyltransferases, including N-acetylases of ribosomal proteins
VIYRLDERYYVRCLEELDMEGPYPTWFEDQDVCRFNGHGKFFQNKKAIRDFVLTANSEKRIVWAMCHVEDGHVGNISLQNISFVDRSAEFAILLGEKRHWGKGLAKLAGDMLLKHGFQKLNLERVYCGTADTNVGMKKLATSLGMIQEGVRRSHLYLEGERVDIIEYGVLKAEYMSELDS